MVVPLLILQILLTYVFYNRHWDTVTRWLAFGVASEVALLAEMIEEAPDAAAREALIERARRNADLDITPDTRRQARGRGGGGRHRRPTSATSTTRSWRPSPSG